MAPKKSKVPTPEELLEEVSGKSAAKTYPFDEYMQAVHLMQTEKGYSFAQIADFLSERLGGKFTKGQVYRGYQMWLVRRAEEENDRPAFDPEEPPSSFDDGEADRQNWIEEKGDRLEEFLEELCPDDEPIPAGPLDILECVRARIARKAEDERAASEADERFEKAKAKKKAE